MRKPPEHGFAPNTSTKAIELVNHALASERLSLRGGGPSHATRMDAIRPVRQNLSRTGRDDARNLHENEVDMNENTTADTSVNATAIDDETLSRAVLTYCLDSADAMMYALGQRHRISHAYLATACRQRSGQS